jgi:hypothetical protein
MSRETKPGKAGQGRKAAAGRGGKGGADRARANGNGSGKSKDKDKGGKDKASHALSSLIRATPRKPAGKLPIKAGTGAARGAARPGGWKTCSRGHNYRGAGPCPVCRPGGKHAGRARKV